MRRNYSRKLRLVLSVGICVLCITMAFSIAGERRAARQQQRHRPQQQLLTLEL